MRSKLLLAALLLLLTACEGLGLDPVAPCRTCTLADDHNFSLVSTLSVATASVRAEQDAVLE